MATRVSVWLADISKTSVSFHPVIIKIPMEQFWIVGRAASHCIDTRCT